jgi:uncharacterized protein (DUF58 family)
LWPTDRALASAAFVAVAAGLAGYSFWFEAVALAGAALLAGCACADAALGPNGRRLRVERVVPERMALGVETTVLYRIENRAPLALRITILDEARDGLGLAPEARARVAAGARIDLELPALPRERGIYRWSRLALRAVSALGLLERRFELAAPGETHVYPDLRAVEPYGNLGRRNLLVDAGLRKLRRRGAGSEFESFREYVTGDPFRAIDFKASARRGRLMVAQSEVERSQQIIVMLDCGRMMVPRVDLRRKFDYALQAALSIATLAQWADDKVGLTAFAAAPLVAIAPRAGSAHVARINRAVFDIQPGFEEPDYERAFADLARRYAKRSLIVLFTDIFDPVASVEVLNGLGRLVPRHLVLCVLMNDAANARALETAPRTAEDAYRASVALTLLDERAKALAHLRARGIGVVDVPAAKLTGAVLEAYVDVKTRGLL